MEEATLQEIITQLENNTIVKLDMTREKLTEPQLTRLCEVLKENTS